MPKKKKSSVTLIVFCVFVVVWLVEMFFFHEKLNEVQIARDAMTLKEEETRKKLEAMERLAEHNREYVNRMLKDPEFRQSEVRARLGVAIPGEVIVREEDAERKAQK